jgi:hypothetical protein
MAKLTVITDSAGEIVGTANYTGEKGAPTLARVSGDVNTTVQVIDVPDDVLRLSASELHVKLKETLAPLSTVRVK